MRTSANRPWVPNSWQMSFCQFQERQDPSHQVCMRPARFQLQSWKRWTSTVMIQKKNSSKQEGKPWPGGVTALPGQRELWVTLENPRRTEETMRSCRGLRCSDSPIAGQQDVPARTPAGNPNPLSLENSFHARPPFLGLVQRAWKRSCFGFTVTRKPPLSCELITTQYCPDSVTPASLPCAQRQGGVSSYPCAVLASASSGKPSLPDLQVLMTTRSFAPVHTELVFLLAAFPSCVVVPYSSFISQESEDYVCTSDILTHSSPWGEQST